MPRSLSTALQTQVSADATKIAFLVKLSLNSTIRLTDHYTNVIYESEVYEAGGAYLEVDSTTESGKLELNDIKITFSNVTDLVRNLVQSGAFTDKEVNISLAYFDNSENIVGALDYFTGNISSVSITETKDNTVLAIQVASHWANWNLTKGRHFSDASQQEFSSGDVGMEFASQVKKDVRWGK
jgi:hypothetical protein